ncbi:MAG: ATP-dependent RNA helicase, partial [Enterococcus sp.]
QLGAAMEEIQRQIGENSDTLEKYNESAQELLAAYSPEELAALLLKTIAKDPSDAVPVKITPERPLPSNKKGGFNRGGGGKRNNNNRGGGRGKDNYRKDRDRNSSSQKNKNYGGNKSRSNSNNKNTNRSNDKKRGFVIRTSSND